MSREKELVREVDHLRRQLIAVKKRDLIRDPLVSGVRAEALYRYVDALAGVALESSAAKAMSLEPKTGGGSDFERAMPSPVPGWAQALFRRELRNRERDAERLETWIESPYRGGQKTKRRCGECGRGLARGHIFCPSCGTMHQEE